MAVFICDRWQGQGVGKTLCLHCLKVAKELGIKRMWMEILKTNLRMLNNAFKLGFKTVSSNEDSVKGSITNSVMNKKGAHLIMCLIKANNTKEVSHEGDKAFLQNKYSIKSDRYSLDRREAIKDKGGNI